MLEAYDDIRQRIPEPPKWFDCHGVPRYDDFHPSLSPNVYAAEVALYEVACQSCNERFLVEENWDRHSLNYQNRLSPLSQRVREKKIHYGDPPIHGCSGDSMNCIDQRTIQFWRRNTTLMYPWVRVPELEGVDLEPDDLKAL